MRILLPLLAVVACADGAEVHARIRFVDGRTLEGDIVARDETRISLATGRRAGDGGLARAVIACPLDRIAAIEELPAPADEYRARAGAAVSADDHAALAAWCRGNGLEAHAAEHAQRALALDPDHAVARRELAALGYSQVDGIWRSPAEILAAGGSTVGGRAVTADEAQRLRDLAGARAEHAKAVREIAALADAIAEVDRETDAVRAAGARADAGLPREQAQRDAIAAIALNADIALAADDARARALPPTTTTVVERTYDAPPVVVPAGLLSPPPAVISGPPASDPTLGAAGITAGPSTVVVIPLPARTVDRRSVVVCEEPSPEAARAVADVAASRAAAERAHAELRAADERIDALIADHTAAADRPAILARQREDDGRRLAALERRRDDLAARIASLETR